MVWWSITLRLQKSQAWRYIVKMTFFCPFLFPFFFWFVFTQFRNMHCVPDFLSYILKMVHVTIPRLGRSGILVIFFMFISLSLFLVVSSLLNRFIILKCMCAFGGGDNESQCLMRLPSLERLMIVQVCKLLTGGKEGGEISCCLALLKPSKLHKDSNYWNSRMEDILMHFIIFISCTNHIIIAPTPSTRNNYAN